jgi:hypothetical protein
MKLPKSRDIIYLVVRVPHGTDHIVAHHEVPIAAFRTIDRASEYEGVCGQEFNDRKVMEYRFETRAIIYYDE